MGRLENKIALIAGAARGQGAAEAARFIEEGATVVLTDVLDDLGRQTAAELGEYLVVRNGLADQRSASYSSRAARTTGIDPSASAQRSSSF